MKRLILTLLTGIMAAGLNAQTTTYEGAWFEISYPENFMVRGSIQSETAADGRFDSAFFTSPDEEVEFYIYSPMWGGTPDDIELQDDEKLSNHYVKNYKENVITFWTISGPGDSYLRSYQKTHNELENTTWIIGIKYISQEAYNRYKHQYLAFKGSLRQMTD